MGRLTEYLGAAGGGGEGPRVEINESVAEAQIRALARLLVNDPATRKDVKRVFSKEIRAARRRVSKDVKNNMDNDPREAYKAVKSAIYKRISGGNISDLSRRGGVRVMGIYRKYRKLDDNPHQWGGNRRKVSDRTKQLDGYLGKDRGFILRFLDAGTTGRMTRYGNRGSIRGTGLFGRAATMQMDTAAGNIGEILEEMFPEVYNEEMEK